MNEKEKILAALENQDLWHVSYIEPLPGVTGLGVESTGLQTVTICVRDAIHLMRHIILEAQTVPPGSDQELLEDFLVIYYAILQPNLNILYNKKCRMHLPISEGGSPIWEDLTPEAKPLASPFAEHARVASCLVLWKDEWADPNSNKLLAV